MHPRIMMFLRERDRARQRGDVGVVRSLNADLLRLGIPTEATMADPTGKHVAKPAPAADAATVEKRRQAKPRCEHGRVPDRCEDCKAAELTEVGS